MNGLVPDELACCCRPARHLWYSEGACWGQVILALFARAYEFEVEDVDEPWFQGFKCVP